MPVGDVLVGDTGGDIEHDDTALAVDVVAIAEATELLLTGSIPDIELNLTEVLILVRSLKISRWVEILTVVKPRGWTSTPRVAMYFFSNSPVKWRLTKVVYRKKARWLARDPNAEATKPDTVKRLSVGRLSSGAGYVSTTKQKVQHGAGQTQDTPFRYHHRQQARA